MYGYIYKTTIVKTGEVYVGQHHGVFDPSYFGSGSRVKYRDKSTMSVEFVSCAVDQADLDRKEVEYISSMRSLHGASLLNILPGGLGTKPETMERIGSALKGRKKSPEHLAKMRAWLNSDAFKEVIRRTHCGKEISIEQRKAHSQRMMGRTLSQETRDKMSAAQRARARPSEETKNKPKETWRRRKESGEFVSKYNQKQQQENGPCV